MRKFFQEYGAVALGILALLVLIAMITPVGNLVKTSLQSTVQTFSSSINSQTDDAMLAVFEAQQDATVNLTNINKYGIKGDFSSIGNIVEINGDKFRVIKLGGTNAEVMMLDNYTNFAYTGSTSVQIGGYTVREYNGSNLDRKMTDYYNSLPEEIQNIIVEHEITQSVYSWGFASNDINNFIGQYPPTLSGWGNRIYYMKKLGETSVGMRKIYALDVDDALEYLGNTATTEEIELFFTGKNSNSTEMAIALRSSYNIGNGIMIYWESGKSIDFHTGNSVYEVHPTFVIDLSLLQ